MRQRRKTIIGIVLAVFFLTGCGGEFSGFSRERTASGGAVSGEAVSGGAVKLVEKDRSENYSYCNEQNLYYVENGTEILTEHNRQSGEEHRLPVKGIRDICYVDEDWVYYVTCSSDGEQSEDHIWRAPVRKEKQWKLDETAAELILERNRRASWAPIYWCNGSYIVYQEPEGEGSTLKLYNIRKKQYEPGGDLGSGFLYVEELFEESVIITCDSGLVEKKLGSDTINLIRGEERSRIIYTESDVLNNELFWMEWEGNEKNDALWRYWLEDGKKEKLLDLAQIRQLLKGWGALEDCECETSAGHEIHLNNLFIRGDHLYAQLWILGGHDVPECRNMIVISKKRDGSGEWEWEKEINEYLHNPEADQKLFGKLTKSGYEAESIYRSRGSVVMMAEDICLMYLEHTREKKNQLVSYDFQTGTFKWLTKQDWQWWLPYYEWGMGLNTHGYSEYMPNNFEME